MGLRINTNVSAINARRLLTNSTESTAKVLEKMSSGNRINKAGDDAAGLAISENLRAQIRGLRQAKRNASDGISLVQVTEGGLNEISNILVRLRELSVQAASDTIGDTERSFTDREFQSLKQEIQRISETTNYNGTPLLSGREQPIDIQVGLYNQANDRLSYDTKFADSRLEALGLTSESVMTKTGAQESLSKLDAGMKQVNEVRSTLGATQNRLQSTINNLAIYDENLSAANSRIRDADMAEESSELVKQQILQQAGVAVLGHANNFQQQALKLLG
ncbi:MAG: flagellin FliC [Proteobacteria bacterium]|nr:MAG: flagellin FliC [Pseudomonadota bacterium]